MHTQCPKCLTIFNVTEEILAVKAGLVRCGDCENVFNATWHLVDDTEFDDDAGHLPETAVDDSLGGDDHGVGDDARLWPENPEEDSEIDTVPDAPDAAPPDGATETRRPTVGYARYERRIERGLPEDGGGESSPPDEKTGARDRFDPEENSSDVTGEPVAPTEHADEDISDEEIRRTLRLDEEFDFYQSDEPRATAPGQTDDGASVPDDGEPRATGSGLRREPRLDPAPDGGLSVTPDDALLPRRPSRRPEPAAPRSPLSRRPAIQLKAPTRPSRPAPDPQAPKERAEIRPDPNVHWVSIPDDKTRGSQLLWASGVLLLIVLVVLQVRFFLVDELYAIPATRPYISLFCEFTGCEPPLRSDPSSIEIAQTRVDLHPEVPGAMRIKVNLINRAEFAQPYPSLQLTLSDKDGRIVGRRTYTPDDYLDAGAGRNLLDPGILAVASINLAHPNENAVGFETEVVATPGG